MKRLTERLADLVGELQDVLTDTRLASEREASALGLRYALDGMTSLGSSAAIFEACAEGQVPEPGHASTPDDPRDDEERDGPFLDAPRRSRLVTMAACPAQAVDGFCAAEANGMEVCTPDHVSRGVACGMAGTTRSVAHEQRVADGKAHDEQVKRGPSNRWECEVTIDARNWVHSGRRIYVVISREPGVSGWCLEKATVLEPSPLVLDLDTVGAAVRHMLRDAAEKAAA